MKDLFKLIISIVITILFLSLCYYIGFDKDIDKISLKSAGFIIFMGFYKILIAFGTGVIALAILSAFYSFAGFILKIAAKTGCCKKKKKKKIHPNHRNETSLKHGL